MAVSPVEVMKAIPWRNAQKAQAGALFRMLLYVTAETHRQMSEVSSRLQRVVLQNGANEPVDAMLGLAVQTAGAALLKDYFENEWLRMFQSLRVEAASLAFGGLAVTWEGVKALAGVSKKQEGITNAGGVFSEQIQSILDAAAARTYGGTVTLSGRIWNLEQASLQGIQSTVMQGVSGKWSAWDLAKKLEGYLGAGADCPRWAASRLYQMNKQDIADVNNRYLKDPAGWYAADKPGLFRGAECAGQGVSYNALRLARTEIQGVHGMATDYTMSIQPWVQQEQIILSGAHPSTGCDCEAIVTGGENMNGVYPKGTVILPIHANCLCIKLAVMMDEDEFAGKLRGWMTGEQQWDGMDQFAQTIGVDLSQDMRANKTSASLGVWLAGNPADLAGRVS